MTTKPPNFKDLICRWLCLTLSNIYILSTVLAKNSIKAEYDQSLLCMHVDCMSVRIPALYVHPPPWSRATPAKKKALVNTHIHVQTYIVRRRKTGEKAFINKRRNERWQYYSKRDGDWQSEKQPRAIRRSVRGPTMRELTKKSACISIAFCKSRPSSRLITTFQCVIVVYRSSSCWAFYFLHTWQKNEYFERSFRATEL